jgi:hypothetical protein
MPFPSQFAMSLELTRLVPLALDAAGKSYAAALSLARNLQVTHPRYFYRLVNKN